MLPLHVRMFVGVWSLWASTSWGTVTLTTLVRFDGNNGAHPVGLLQGRDGHFYGTTFGEGNSNYGNIFRLTSDGAFTNLVSLTTNTGEHPYSSLIQGLDGNFYGTTQTGGNLPGAESNGTLFQLTPNGALNVLFSFGVSDGFNPGVSLIQDASGNFYGATIQGPVRLLNGAGFGSVFEFTASGEFHTLASFDGSENAYPYGSLTFGLDGALYGTTYSGGMSNLGTVFQVTSNGVNTLISFTGTNGAKPACGLIVGKDGNFYGTTSRGGLNDAGTVFRISPLGALTILAFFNHNNGNGPFASLLAGSDGTLYGTSSAGRSSAQWGSIFKVSTNGVLTTVYAFHGGANGAHPFSSVIRGSDANLYGATYFGGIKENGTIYRLSFSRPVLAITKPRQNARLTNAVITITGKSMGADPVTAVYCRANATDWSVASSTNAWTNWICDLTLSPGLNLVEAYALSSLGKSSLTNKLKLTYVVYAPVTVMINGNGSVSPNYNGRSLEIGKSYTLTARPGQGFAFQNWSGSVATNLARLSFVMDSNLTFQASFVDVMRPICSISYPSQNRRLTNDMLTMVGKASDNSAVSAVYYRINGTDWNLGTSSNYWKNWTADLGLFAGTNLIQTYAIDETGNTSLTNFLKIFH